MVGDGKPCVFVGTFLENGQSINVCDEHFEGFLISSLTTVSGKNVAYALSTVEHDLTQPPAGIEPTEEEAAFQEWLDGHQDEILALTEEGNTFEQAVQIVLAKGPHADDPEETPLEPTN
jgi:hypothetical protein